MAMTTTKTTNKATYGPLLAELAENQARHSPRSAAIHQKARRYLVDGGSHPLRLLRPFPPRIAKARGGWLEDEDGHDILDFWQGHMANVLGHNPEVVARPLGMLMAGGFGLQSGLADALQADVAEILCQRTGNERVRFTTSGTLANMYAVFLASAYTGRDGVLKVGGGWHGAQPWSLKGVGFQAKGGVGFEGVETEGIPPVISERTLVTGFNDPQQLEDDFRRYGDQLACFVVEPVVGAGGLVPATQEYLQLARRLCTQFGALLILDEVITGFRLRAGDAGAIYGVKPDLAIFGKAIGGGMPVAAVAGQAEIMELAGRERGSRVGFSGGTYSAHPASLLAGKLMMTHLIENEDQVYPRLAQLGEKARRRVEEAFRQEGVHASCTGSSDELPGSSLFFVHFPYRADTDLRKPGVLADPAHCDVELTRRVLEVALLAQGVHLVHGHGALATVHTEGDVDVLEEACRQVARCVKPYR